MPYTKELAEKEFRVIRDVLIVPLKNDLRDEELPEHRRWKGGCLYFQPPSPEPLALPDLVPVNPNPRLGSLGFCKKGTGADEGKLLVTVKNQGNAQASASTTRVRFFSEETFVKEVNNHTPEIPVGESREVKFEVPEKLTVVGFAFTIVVNADNKVVESDTTNNNASGECKPIR